MDTVTEPTAADPDEGWEWMAVEVFGHRRHAGRVREEERFGAKLLRIDVPIDGDPETKGWATHFYGGSAIFSLRLTDRATALKANRPYEPPARLSLAAPDEDEPDDAETGPIPF